MVLWVQNSHAAPIPSGTIALDRMGAEQPVPVPAGGGTVRDASRSTSPTCCPELHWPAQIEMRAGRHVVRPRYEVTRGDRVRIAHVNVERADLKPDLGDPRACRPNSDAAILLPFPVLRAPAVPHHRPADADGASGRATLPLRLDVFDEAGGKLAERFLGCLPRDHGLAARSRRPAG